MDKDVLLLMLNEKWKCTLPFGWIPLTSDEVIPNTEVYDSEYLQYYLEEIKEIIRSEYETQILYELREDGQFKELSLAECDFEYDGLEYIYTNESLDFVLYFSHENSSTIGGKLLLDKLHKIWKDYDKHFWEPYWN